jgi:hypothetical protein
MPHARNSKISRQGWLGRNTDRPGADYRSIISRSALLGVMAILCFSLVKALRFNLIARKKAGLRINQLEGFTASCFAIQGIAIQKPPIGRSVDHPCRTVGSNALPMLGCFMHAHGRRRNLHSSPGHFPGVELRSWLFHLNVTSPIGYCVAASPDVLHAESMG